MPVIQLLYAFFFSKLFYSVFKKVLTWPSYFLMSFDIISVQQKKKHEQ